MFCVRQWGIYYKVGLVRLYDSRPPISDILFILKYLKGMNSPYAGV